MSIKIVHVHTPDGAAAFVDELYCPVECSFGSHGSVVDELTMDHHGEHSHLEGVAIRAYRDFFGARRDDATFVVTGAADADATFAIAALAGLLPHPSRAEELADKPPYIQKALTRDLSALAEMVNTMDVDPIGVRRTQSIEGRLHILWQALSPRAEDALSFYAGVDRWRMITGPECPVPLLEAAAAMEAERVRKGQDAIFMETLTDVAAVEGRSWAFDVWYETRQLIVAFVAGPDNITIGCQDAETAEKLLGPGGLRNIFPILGAGWGGREAIGGSPRGQTMKRQEAVEAAVMIQGMINQRRQS